MSASSPESGSFISGTPVKARPAAPAPGTEATSAHLFARRALPVLPAKQPPGGVTSALRAAPCAVAAVPNRAPPPPLRFAAPAAAPAAAEPTLRAGQGALLLRRGAGSFSRLAEQRQQQCASQGLPPPAASASAVAARPLEPHQPAAPVAAGSAAFAAARTHVAVPALLTSPRPAAAAAAAPAAHSPVHLKRAPETAAEKPPAKRARAAAGPTAASLAKAPRAGSTRDNFVRLQLGKGRKFKGAGGRKFVTGASKPRPRRPSKSRVPLADSTAEAPPLIDDDLGLAQPARRPAAAARTAAAPARAPAVRAGTGVTPEMQPLVASAQEQPSLERLSAVLRDVFGFPSFRDGQLRVVQQTLAGRSCLAILPTGQGKSLCYQLAALLLPGVTLVVSPLVALMDDQLAHLPPALPGAVLHSGQQPEDSAAVLEALKAGALKVLFVAPERLLSRRFLELATSLPAHARFTFACVDECHCVSEWSHNFRPAYYHLGRVLRGELGIARILALTATATRRTEAAVATALSIAEEDIIRTACMRENLRLTVSREVKRDAALLAMLRPGGRLEHAKSVIAYASYKGEADRMAQFLFTNGVTAVSYHAGKTTAERVKAQTLFHSNRVRVVVATVAFGMGLDKSDVAAVVNVGLPRSIEAYVQQAGRAGRDGSEARCHTFLDDEEYLRLRSLTFSDGVDAPELQRLVERIFPPTVRAGDRAAVVPHTAELELGVRQEVIETVLSYLQLGEGLPGETPFIAALPDMRATVHLAFHKSDPRDLAAGSPLVAQLLQLGRERGGRHTASVPALANAMGISFAQFQEQLQALAAGGEVSYTHEDRALCMQVVRPPCDTAALVAALAERLSAAEQCQVGKLDTIFTAAAAAVQCSVPAEQEAELRRRIAAYFEALGGTECTSAPALVTQSSQHLVSDIRAVLRQARDVLTSSRLVARVMHGLSGAHITADAWRSNPAWGKHARVDFNAVLRAAEAELAAQRRA